jgi:hypothetical protein
VDERLVAEFRHRQATGMHVAALAPRDDLVHERADLFRARLGRLDALRDEERPREAAQDGRGMTRIRAERTAFLSVSHRAVT